jgi:tetratricopeptide (TPR) repeat protein
MDRGNLAIGRGQCALAVELFSMAGLVAPSEGEWILALKGKANALVLSERYADAARVFRRLVEADRADRTSRFNLAVTLTRLRQFSEAEGLYLELLGEQADHVQARYNLASLYQGQGKLAQAREQWRQVVRQAPQLASAQAALGEVLLQLGRADEAQAAYREAALLAKNDPAVWSGLALASRAAGHLEAAAAAARRSVQLAERDAAAWRLLGDVLLDLYRLTDDARYRSEAAEAWRRSLALDGSQDDLRRILATAGGEATTQPAPTAASRGGH